MATHGIRNGKGQIMTIENGNSVVKKMYYGTNLVYDPTTIPASAPPAPAYVTDSLYVYVDPFAGFDGTTITDLSPTPKTITRGNSITTTGTIGGTGGWNLNATSPSSKYFYFNNPLTSATDWSFEVFFRVNTGVTFNGEPNFLSVLGSSNFDIRFGMKPSAGNVAFCQVQGQAGNGCDSARSSTSIIDNNWHQWVYTFKQSTRLVTLYKDGVSASTCTPAADTFYSSTTVNMYAMGPINASFLWGWNGALGGLVRVYTKQLSSTEVLQNYNANKADYGL